MDFIDYYAVLNLPKTARIKDIQKVFDEIISNPPDPEVFETCARAYTTLINPYKRARYDKLMGYLIVIQIVPSSYFNAKCLEINSIQPYASLHGLITKFKNWIEKKFDYDWAEAQLAQYSYHLENKQNESYLLLRFPTKSTMESFEKYLITNKLVKNI
jgi:curved DNA-binding protein CbpA